MNTRRLILILCLMVYAGSCIGCYSIRKKFTRKKTSEEETPVYVQVKEYAAVPTEKVYRDYYVFLRGWLDDLKIALQDQSSLKRSKKAIDEAIMNFTQMYQSLNGPGKKERSDILEELMNIKKTVYNPGLFSTDTSRLIARVDKVKRVLEKQMRYEAVSGYLKSE